ncbi:Heparanase-like protein 1 isoform B [Glycine soja]|uniref:Heparanase-like protein 1 isoform B n=1 Tax=Glycine soja TaxID=3848 RepID=A0A445G9J6_GLYSO|nr:Heparanase-like protein 1 isoform B [Glycine soja]
MRKYERVASAFVRRLLVVREDLFLEDVGDLPKSEYVECASNVDDEKSTVPLGIGFSDMAFENCVIITKHDTVLTVCKHDPRYIPYSLIKPFGTGDRRLEDLSHPFLAKAIQALRPLRIRLGGSLQDQVLYDVGSLKSPCHSLQKVKGGLFGFSKGCLHMKRWDELNQFFYETGYLDQLGIASCYSTKVYCRQTLIGGNYGLLNTTTFAPNPDYYK